MSERVRILVEIEPMTGKRWETPDPLYRLRGWLKSGGRRFGWRCCSVKSVVPLSLVQASSARANAASSPNPHTDSPDLERQQP